MGKPGDRAEPASAPTSTLRLVLLPAALGVLVYLPSLAGGFLYDDSRVVVNNPSIRDLGSLGTVLRAEPSRPLLGLTWALNYAVSGLRAWPYHLVNVILHAGNAALLALLFRWMGERSGRKEPGPAAIAAACLFAASPMAAETVAYVSSRSTALATVFVLGSLWIAVGLFTTFSRTRLAGAMALFLLGLATKEEAASLPLLLLLLDFFFVARLEPRDVLSRARVHLPFLAVLPLGFAARALATGAWLPAPALHPLRFVTTQLAVFPQYVLRALIPLDPAFYRGHPAAAWPPQLWALLGWAGTAALVVLAVRGRRRWPEWSFAVAWLAAGLLPSSSILPLKEMIVDHRAYLGSAGIAFALGGLAWNLGRARLMAALVIVFATVAVRYEWILSDPTRAWVDAVRRAPRSAEAWRALGDAWDARGDARAERALRTAVALAPGDAAGWTNLGALYVARGRLPEAAAAMRRAAQGAPGDSRIQHNLGLILLALGQEAEAREAFEAAVAGSPPIGEPRVKLAELLFDRGDTERVRALLDEALRLPLEEDEADRAYRLYQRLPQKPGS
jgi:tetratricopeptide (TPR) repeat protein